jgi:putative transposase
VCVPTSTLRALARLAIQGGRSNYTKYPDAPDDHAIGRSRGGLTTKIHALSDQSCSPVTVVLSAGQAGDNPMLWPLLDARKAASEDRFRLLGDKAYSHDSTRVQLRQRKIAHTIPERSDQIARRKAKGSEGAARQRSPGGSTSTATPLNAASTDSNTGAPLPPATTSTP